MGAWGSNGTKIYNFRRIEKVLIDQIKIIKKILPTKNYSLNQINKAIKDFTSGNLLRPIIKF